MKKTLRTLLCTLIMGSGIFSYNFTAYASGELFTDDRTKTYYMSASSNLKWLYNSYKKCWNFGDNVNEQEFKTNCWVYDNGKWYFISRSGNMVTDTVVYTNYGSYYMQEDGSMLTNGYCKIRTGSAQIESEWYADESGLLR